MPVTGIAPLERCTFYRYLATAGDTYYGILNAQHDWRDLQLLNFCDLI